MMRKVFSVTLKLIARLIALLLAALTIVATVLVLLLLSFNRTLLNPRSYEQAFIKNKVYDRFPAVTAQEFALVKSLLVDTCTGTDCADGSVNTSQSDAESTNKLGFESKAFINGLSSDQWRALIINSFPPEEVKAMMESTVDEIIQYFKGQTDTIRMPLIKLNARLTGQASEGLTLLLLESQPPCTLEQQTLIMSGEIGKEGSAPIFCSATGGTAQVLSLDLQRRLNNVSSEIPEHAIFIKPPSPSNPPSLRQFIGENRQATLQKINAASPNIPLLPFALLVLVALFGVRSLRGWLRWWGIPIFIAGLTTLALGVILFFWFDLVWARYVLPYLSPALGSGFGEIGHDVAHSLTRDLSKWILLQAGLVTVSGFVIILVSNRVPPPPDPSLPPLAPPGTPGGPVLHPQKKKKRW